jgi:hypothetical protein
MNLRESERGQVLSVRERHVSGFVIPSEARDLQFAAKCRFLASLGMTRLEVEPSSYAGVSPYLSCRRRSIVRKIRPSTA